MPPVKKEGMSAFEQRRLANIAENQARLSEIAKTTVNITKVATPKVSRARKVRTPVERRVQPKREPAVGTRASSRLKGEEAKRELPDDTPAALMPDRPAKKSRVADDLELGKVMVEGRKFADDLSVFGRLLPLRGAEPGVRTFDDDDIRGTTDKELKTLRENMRSLELYDKWAVNGAST